MIPKWLRKYLNESDLVNIESAISNIEKHTSGEVVPMIVHRSSVIRMTPVIVFVLLFTMMNIFFEFIYQTTFFVSLNQSIIFYIFGIVLCIIFSYLLASFNFVQRLFVHPLDRDYQSNQRALFEFYNLGLNKTDGSTGILLFVSIMDREVVILADKGINEKIKPESWIELKNQMILNLKNKKMGLGFTQAIEACGEILKVHFPVSAENKNELMNKLIIKD